MKPADVDNYIEYLECDDEFNYSGHKIKTNCVDIYYFIPHNYNRLKIKVTNIDIIKYNRVLKINEILENE